MPVVSLDVRFSNRPSGVKRFQAIHQLQCRCRSRARASLRTRHHGPSIMGFEDEVEQSYGRPCRRCSGRFKPTYEPTSSIVPRGTPFHRWGGLRFLLFDFFLFGSYAAATSFFIPRCLAIFIAQALSQDHGRMVAAIRVARSVDVMLTSFPAMSEFP